MFISSSVSKLALTKAKAHARMGFFYPNRAEIKGFGDELEICRGEQALEGANGCRFGVKVGSFPKCHHFVSGSSLTKSPINGLMPM